MYIGAKFFLITNFSNANGVRAEQNTLYKNLISAYKLESKNTKVNFLFVCNIIFARDKIAFNILILI